MTYQNFRKIMTIIMLNLLISIVSAQSQKYYADFNYSINVDTKEVSFFDRSEGEYDYTYWDFGDYNESTLTNPVHQYADTGEYMVCLEVGDNDSYSMICKDVVVREGIVNVDANFSFTNTPGSLEIKFANQTIGNVDSVFWDFGDGDISTEMNPVHTFAEEDIYLVCLYAFSDGYYDILCHSVEVIKDDCQADFEFVIDTSRPNKVEFTNLSMGTITQYQWDFNDNPDGGSTSVVENPEHFFPKNDTFNVKLIITGNNCTDEISKTVHIDVPLDIDFSFVLDSNNVVPNTFLFDADISGKYDELLWDFESITLSSKEDTIYSYPEQNTDYQVCLTAIYHFNDTSDLKKVLCKGLTTSEYFDMGGQSFFGDSLINNPNPTGDTAIAYLYRIDRFSILPVDTNYYTYLGYYSFPQKIKAYYIIKTALSSNSTHFDDYAPTYVGNTTQWDEAEIINLAQDRYRDDIHLVPNNNNKSGQAILAGSIYDMLDLELYDNAVVCLYDLDENLVEYQYPDEDGDYLFENLEKGHYLLSADVTGIPVRQKLIYINSKGYQDYKEDIIDPSGHLFPNPAHDYSILSYENSSEDKSVIIQVFAADGSLVSQQKYNAQRGSNFFRIDLSQTLNGLLLVKVIDEGTSTYKVLHY